MTLPGSSAARRGLALGVLGLLALLLWAGPVSAYFALIDSGSDQLAQRLGVLQRYRSLVAAPRSATVASGAPLLYPDIPEAQAAATLQETVKAAAATNGIQIRSLQMLLRGDTPGDGAKIGVRIRAIGDSASLGRLLYAIENSRPVLYPDNLQIQSQVATQAPGNSAGNLEFQLDVSGFRTESAS